MQEQLITFETAKLAKEKGFDIKVRRYFCNGQLSGDMEQLANWNIQAKTHTSAPTQSLLQRWLREEFNIIIEVAEYYNAEDLPLSNKNFPKPLGYFYWDRYDSEFCEENAEKFSTHEEALEFGLQEALKLIK